MSSTLEIRLDVLGGFRSGYDAGGPGTLFLYVQLQGQLSQFVKKDK